MSLERQERLLGLSDGEYDYAYIRRGLATLFPDHIIAGERRDAPKKLTFPEYRPSRGRFGKGGGRGNNYKRGDRGRFVAHETNEGYDEENYQDGPEEHFIGDDNGAGEAPYHEGDLNAAFEVEMEALAATMEHLGEDLPDVEDLTDLNEHTSSEDAEAPLRGHMCKNNKTRKNI